MDDRWSARRPAADDKWGSKVTKDPVLTVTRWVKARSHREKLMLGGMGAILVLFILYRTIEDHDTLFVLSEAVHFLGIGLLLWKLMKKKNVGGLSLRSQELTATFLAVRLVCSYQMEYDIHTLLDLLTLGATGWVTYLLWVPLREHYDKYKEQDAIKLWYVLVPCLALALVSHPSTRHPFFFRVMWAFCVYLEAVSVLPQLVMMQKAKVVEKFTGHYVFALGVSRFISCAHWVLQLVGGDTFVFRAFGMGVWPACVLLSEVVQTFILADFCFYYVKSYAEGTGVIHLPAGIV